jgi:NAD(P)-dependent dehydrogenase (short-subunit alcohol dehydrogenase family)
MSMDPRVGAVDGFTATKHKSVPPGLDPSGVKLPEGYAVCVIGASAGIGEHIAYSFAKANATHMVIASRTLGDLEGVAAEMRRIHPHGLVTCKTCDVSNASDVEALAEYVKSEVGRLDVLILNAGYAGPVTTKMDQGRPEWVLKAFEVNAMGTYLAAHYFVPLLLQSNNGAKGFLVVGSIAGCIRRGPIANTGYTVSKMAQIRLVEYLHEQYSDEGLVSLAIHPGAVMTRMASGNTPEVFLPCKSRFFYLEHTWCSDLMY